MIPTIDGRYNLTILFKGGELTHVQNANVMEGDWSVQIDTEKEIYIINKENILFIRAEKKDAGV